MLYETSELSEYNARPFFLYKFVRGTTINTFTSNNNLISYDGEDYLPSPVSHRGINQTGQVERVNLDIVFPKSDAFARAQFSPDYNNVTFLTIFRGHSDFPDDIQVMWKGRITAYKVGGSSIVLTCENIQTTVRRNGLREAYQRTCRHSLYGPGCRLNLDDWLTAFTVGTVTDNTFTVTAMTEEDNYYTGGILKFGENLGFITNHTGTTLTLLNVMPDLVDGSAVSLAPGCNLTRSTCETKFDNVLNFGGFPYIPSRNPFNGFAAGAIT